MTEHHFEVVDCGGVAASFFDYRAAINHLVELEAEGCGDFCGPNLHQLMHHGIPVHNPQDHLAYRSARRSRTNPATPGNTGGATERKTK